MQLCPQRKRRTRTTASTGLRSLSSTKTRRQGGESGADNGTLVSTATSGANQHQHRSTAPQTAREHTEEPPLQAPPPHDVKNTASRQGLDGDKDSASCSERLGDDRAQNENEDCIVVITASDGRVACTNCQRWFSSDRVGVHQNICKRVNPPSARDTSKREQGGTASSKKAKFTSSRVESRRRKSGRSTVGETHAAARTRWGRGRSVGGEKSSIKDHHPIDDARDIMVIK